MRRAGMRGFTLIELMVVVTIMSVLLGIAGSSLQTYQARYEAENQVRLMHADMMQARFRAFERNKRCFVKVTTDSYQVIEDTNDSGGSTADSGDTALWPVPKRLKYKPCWTGTIVMNERGTISSSSGGILCNNPLSIRFETAGAGPEYDCIAVNPTRLNAGKWNGKKCVAR